MVISSFIRRGGGGDGLRGQPKDLLDIIAERRAKSLTIPRQGMRVSRLGVDVHSALSARHAEVPRWPLRAPSPWPLHASRRSTQPIAHATASERGTLFVAATAPAGG